MASMRTTKKCHNNITPVVLRGGGAYVFTIRGTVVFSTCCDCPDCSGSHDLDRYVVYEVEADDEGQALERVIRSVEIHNPEHDSVEWDDLNEVEVERHELGVDVRLSRLGPDVAPPLFKL